jgi:hypothetical protein
MNTFWLKIAGAVVAVVVVIVAVKSFTSSESKPKPDPKTVQDMWRQDNKRLTADPVPKDTPNEPNVTADANTAVAATDKGSGKIVTPTPPKPQFKQLSQIEKIEAERLFNVAITHRKMGRLQGIGLSTMVQTCRQIIEKFPGSEYEFKAKRMLGDIPERFRDRFKITEEEIDLGDWK